MSGSSEAAFQRYKIEKGKLDVAVKKLELLTMDSSESALYWSAFVQSTKNAVAALVRSGTLHSPTRGVAHKIKNWENSDRVFKYLLHARNAEVHAEEHNDSVPNPIRPQSLTIGGNLIRIEGHGTVSLVGNTVNGVAVPDGVYTLEKDGTVSSPSLHAEISFSPMQLDLKPVSDKQGNTYKFPFEIVPDSELPEVFAAKHVVIKLEIWENELRALRIKN